jgi:hypothetical protein
MSNLLTNFFIHDYNDSFSYMADKLLYEYTIEAEIYYSNFFNIDYKFDEKLSLDQKWELLNNFSNINYDLIYYSIKYIKYNYFLQTPYWKVISEIKKRDSDYKCNLCNSGEKLETHHKTYDHRGDEIRHMNDLIVICNDCHRKFHDRK